MERLQAAIAKARAERQGLVTPAQIAATRGQLKAQLMEALTR